MASNLERGSSSQDSDALMKVPYLDYVNAILMDEGIDDATLLQQACGTSNYQAIFNSLQDILAESAADDQFHKSRGAPPPPGSLLQSSPPQGDFQQVNDGAACNFQAIYSSLQDLISNSATNDLQLHETTGALLPRDQYSLPATGHPQSNFRQGEETLDGVLLTDRAMLSCNWGKDRSVVDGLRGQTGHGYGSCVSKPPSAREQFSSEVAELDLSFEDLKLEDVCSSICVAKLDGATSGKHNEDKRRSMAPREGRFLNKHTSEVPVFVDVREVLLSCAEAVAIGDCEEANKILHKLYLVYGATAHGNGLQRMAYIFSRALAARMRGTGVQEFEAMSRDMPSSAAVLRALKVDFELSPYQQVVHYFANQSILKAAEGASRLHIVDYGIKSGLQWPCLINALGDRKGGPPLLVITGIEFPQPGIDMAAKLAESERRLAAYAQSRNVPFQFVGIVTDKWEDLDAASLLYSETEVLVVNCVKCLCHLADDSTNLGSPISPRQKFFTCVHSLNPQLLVTGFMNAAHSSPFFLPRFREALNFYSNLFDMQGTLWGDIPERLIVEKSYIYHSVINIIACEGAERVERPETYKQWHARITKAGFEQLPIPALILKQSKAHVKQHYHKDFLTHDDGKGWMLLGWKGRPMLAMSTWRPCHVC